MLWLGVLFDAIGAFASLVIAGLSLGVARKRAATPFVWLLGLFGAIVALGGATSAVEALRPRRPSSWLAVFKALRAATAAGTAVAMVRVTPSLLRLPSPIADALTGLPNRLLFDDRAEHAVVRARRSGEGFAVLFVDVDDFKHINDTLGHAYGDAALIAVAMRLRRSVRATDTVARYGGDEFVVLLERAITPDSVRELIERILASFAAPLQVGDHRITIGASIGAVVSRGASDARELLAKADRAMYDAKSNRRGSFELIDERFAATGAAAVSG